MTRRAVRSMLAFAVLAVVAAGARADDLAPGRRLIIREPVGRAAPVPVSPIIYLERCRGGCVIHQGDNDARVGTSKIPMSATARISEFRNAAGATGAAADAEWNQIAQCMREVYSPY